MEENTNHQSQHQPRTNMARVFISMLLLLGIGGLAGYSIATSQPVTLPEERISPTPLPTEIPQQTRKLLQEQAVAGGRVAAYRLLDEWSEDPNVGVYAVVLEVGQSHPVIFSTVSPAFTDTSVFAIVADAIWLVNAQTQTIDAYTFETEKVVDGVTQLSRLTYAGSFSLPENGKVYGIECGTTDCIVRTARHQESGCTMKLAILTGAVSNIQCTDPSQRINLE